MAGGESWNRFSSAAIESEDTKEAVLKCRLKGFKPSKHTSKAEVRDDILYVEATMDKENYRYKIKDIGVKQEDVVHKPSNGEIEVKITKPADSPGYSLASKLPKI